MKPFLPDLSHIYIVDGAMDYPLAHNVIERYPRAERITVPDYKMVFNRKGQDFIKQKNSIKLILAIKKPPFIYPSTDILQDAGFENFTYTTPLLNCLYNCQYCFLQGMYPSANLVAFVNEEDFFLEAKKSIDLRKNKNQPLALSISYNTDLMAFENIIPFCKRWIEFTREQKDITIEIRTKSAFSSSLNNVVPHENIILGWTLSPDAVIEQYEWDTPPLEKRIQAVREMMEKGWKVRLCFDPIMTIDHWQDVYAEFLDNVFSSIPAERIYDVVVGVFRMNKDFFQRARKREPKVDIYYKQYEMTDSVLSISSDELDNVRSFFDKALSNYIEKSKIDVWGR